MFGTRPEAIKMAMPILELKKRKNIEVKVCVSGQHRELLDGVLDVFDISPDYDLDIMKHGQDLQDISAKIMLGLRDVLKEFPADIVVVHGDTTTAFIAALTAYYQKIKVAHIEAGLRTNNIYSPFPEEGNRKMIDAISSYLFTPTALNEKALLTENADKSKIFVVGNTVVDALLEMKNRIETNENLQKDIVEKIGNAGYDITNRKIALITTHRRENIGKNLENIYNAIKILAQKHTDTDFLVVLHPNPVLFQTISPIVSNIENIKILRDVDYYSFMFLMSKSYIIMTDSGGIQEEAPNFGVPVFVLRDTTERPEGIECGVAKMLGTESDFIVEEVDKILVNPQIHKAMSGKPSPYGDGKTSVRIADILSTYNL